MVSTRPADKVVNEVSFLVGYQLMRDFTGTLEIGSDSRELFGASDSFFIKNTAEEVRLVDTMRRSTEITVKGRTTEGAQRTDVYSLKGFAQALERASQECR